MVRLFHWTAKDLYEFYNLKHPDWPNLPPPPNPRGLQSFFFACVEKTIEQMNRENGGGDDRQRAKQERARRFKQRQAAGDIPR